MPEKERRKFNRGIRNGQTIEVAKSFFCSPLGRKIMEGSQKSTRPFQICIRDNYFNIYWNGCSVMKFIPGARKNKYTIHHKYVHGKGGENAYLSMDQDRESQLNDLTIENHTGWSFYGDIVEPAINGCEVPVLKEYVDKSDGNRLKEKALLKLYLESDERPFLIDLEVAFFRMNEENKPVADRIDMAEIVYDEKGTPVLRLVEVKASDDSRLRAQVPIALKESPKKIMYQMNLYQNFLNNEMTSIVESYRRIASNMLELGFDHYMKGLGDRSATDVLQDFFERGVVDPKPHLLVLYSEQDRYVEDAHFQRLKEVIAQKYPPLRHVCVT